MGGELDQCGRESGPYQVSPLFIIGLFMFWTSCPKKHFKSNGQINYKIPMARRKK